jgi:hypothetical protein
MANRLILSCKKGAAIQTMNISLPEPMKQYADQEFKAKEVLEQTLLAALKESEPAEATPEWWAALRKEVTKRAKARRPTKES